MADATTPNYNFVLPAIGLDRDVWGDLNNANWTAVDADLKVVDNNAANAQARINNLLTQITTYIEPVGTVKIWPAPNAPPGWFPCDGWAISRTDYADLFAVIGGYWGVGDGATTFNIPDFQGYTPVHRGWWMPAINSKLGEYSHTLSEAEMPYHQHGGSTDVQGYHAHTLDTLVVGATAQAGQGNTATVGGQIGTYGAGNHAHNVVTDFRGSNGAHNNIQPSVGVLWIIKAVHVGF